MKGVDSFILIVFIFCAVIIFLTLTIQNAQDQAKDICQSKGYLSYDKDTFRLNNIINPEIETLYCVGRMDPDNKPPYEGNVIRIR